MKITIVSDLHLEFSNINLHNGNNADVLILSGDIMPAKLAHLLWLEGFLENCQKEWGTVLYVPGNHEYYDSVMEDANNILENVALESGVTFLNNANIIIDDVLFIGSTLWTSCNNQDPYSMLAIEQGMNDFRVIRKASNELLLPRDTVALHEMALRYISSTLHTIQTPLKTVISTHHAPSFSSAVQGGGQNRLLDGAYASELSEFILNHPRIALWTHGHLHTKADYMIGPTRIVNNPRGYFLTPNAHNSDWDPSFTVEI